MKVYYGLDYPPKTDRYLFSVHIVSGHAVLDSFTLVARDEDEVRFRIARMEEYMAYPWDELEIVIASSHPLRPSKDS